MSVSLVTNFGTLKIELHCQECPKTCENFLALSAKGYYNNCIFHRNIKGFMTQTGDPSGTGTGGVSIWLKTFEDELNPSLRHLARGVVSMANSGPNSNGSQFFITFAKHPHLDMKYTVFGKLIDGFDALEDIEKAPTDSKTHKPYNDIFIKEVIIHANPFAES